MSIDELKALLKEKAAEKTLYEEDDADLYGSCGGNIDDAYTIGCTDGEISYARELLSLLEA